MKDVMSNLQQTNSEKLLLSWVRQCTRSYPQINVLNFTTSWVDGLALNGILHHFRWGIRGRSAGTLAISVDILLLPDWYKQRSIGTTLRKKYVAVRFKNKVKRNTQTWRSQHRYWWSQPCAAERMYVVSQDAIRSLIKLSHVVTQLHKAFCKEYSSCGSCLTWNDNFNPQISALFSKRTLYTYIILIVGKSLQVQVMQLCFVTLSLNYIDDQFLRDCIVFHTCKRAAAFCCSMCCCEVNLLLKLT